MPQRERPATRPRFRPSDLLPWADPHIRSLVEQLQDEVREEEASRRQAAEELAATATPIEDWSPRHDQLFTEALSRRF